MRRISLLTLSFLSLLTLSACNWFAQTPEPKPEETPVEEPEQEVMEDVTYEGTLEPAGISIYMQGSHRLIMDDGDFLLLESDDLDLEAYEDEDVSVTGDVRPTVEAGGLIMTVKRIERISEEEIGSSSSSSSEEKSSSSSSSSSSEVSSIASSKASVASSVAVSSVAASSVSGGTSDTLQARANIMAKDDISPSLWTQQYCTSHIGFCIPVHKNWWFKSFGTTTNYLWHVEMGPEELLNLGDGPLVVNLLSGSIDAKGVEDGAVVTQGDYVIGYRAWTENRHFEISAPTNLKSAVAHITKSLTVYDAE